MFSTDSIVMLVEEALNDQERSENLTVHFSPFPRFSWVRLGINGTKHVLKGATRECYHRARLGEEINIGDKVGSLEVM